VPDAQGLRRGIEIEGGHKITAPAMVMYGYQDYEPITQAYLIKDHIPQTRITFIDECGHIP
jgi:pimeloyl-ACP methyl ester carboxylesterase